MKFAKTASLTSVVACAMIVAIGLTCRETLAQNYPAKPVRVVVTVAAGGLQDQLARGIAQSLSSVWNQTVIVENRPGAGGVAAAESVARAAPDGLSILQTDNNWYLTNTFLRTNLSYNLEKDLTPAIMLVFAKNILVATQSLLRILPHHSLFQSSESTPPFLDTFSPRS